MLFKNREQQVHAHICQEIEDRLARSAAPNEIRQFLLERWSFLLAGIYFSHGDKHPDWEAGWHTVNGLLWSLMPKQTLEETEQLLRLMPTLLSRLQDGCEAMNLPEPDRDELFSLLAMLHAAVMRAGLQTRPGEPSGASRGAQHADQTFPESELASLDARVTPEAAPLPETAPAAKGIEGIKPGTGVRIQIEGQWKTLFLQWLSPMGGMYLFADKDGFDAVSLTRARLADKFQRGEAELAK